MEEWKQQFLVCIEEAKQFAKVANSIDQFDIDKMIEGGMYPFAVNISFACELFLKAIKIFEVKGQNYKKTHNLYKLYNNISKQAKEKIKENFDEYDEDNVYDLYKFLKEEGDSFLEWRYSFENICGMSVSKFTLFSRALEKYVESLRGRIDG